jgi:hypothetical protein
MAEISLAGNPLALVNLTNLYMGCPFGGKTEEGVPGRWELDAGLLGSDRAGTAVKAMNEISSHYQTSSYQRMHPPIKPHRKK